MSGNGRRYSAFTQRERAFCRHYVAGNNGKQSAIQAGYAKTHAKQQAHKLLQRQQILDEIERLRGLHAKAVDQALTGVLRGHEPAGTDQMPLELRANVDAETVALVDRNYAIAGLVQTLEMALGRRKTTLQRPRERKDGGVTILTYEMIKVDLPVAVRCAETLLKHLGEPKPLPGQPDKVSPEIVAVLDGFRAVVARYKARTKFGEEGDGSDRDS
jgi:hypothetical protein